MPSSPRAGVWYVSFVWGTPRGGLTSPPRNHRSNCRSPWICAAADDSRLMSRIIRPAASGAAYLGGYSADARRYDELLDGSGAIRPHWKALFDRLGSESGADVTRRGVEL